MVTRIRLTRWLLVVPVALAVVAAGFAVPATAQSAGQSRDPRQVAASWTTARRAGALPRDVVLDAVAPIERGNGNGKGKPGSGGTGDATGVVTGSSWDDSSTDPVDDSVAKVFFSLGGQDYVCSASVVEPAAGGVNDRSVVLTAGHCTWDDDDGYATDFLIVPDYDAFVGSTCYLDVDCWVADSLHASAGWRAPGDDYVHDFAFVSVNGTLAASVGPDAVVPIALGLTPPTEVHAFGYPAAKKYSGHDLVYCAGPTTNGPGSFSDNVGLQCDMTGGSSGGPWYADFDGDRVAVSLNSFGLRGYNGYMFGPVFDTQAIDALAAASA